MNIFREHNLGKKGTSNESMATLAVVPGEVNLALPMNILHRILVKLSRGTWSFPLVLNDFLPAISFKQ